MPDHKELAGQPPEDEVREACKEIATQAKRRVAAAGNGPFPGGVVPAPSRGGLAGLFDRIFGS